MVKIQVQNGNSSAASTDETMMLASEEAFYELRRIEPSFENFYTDAKAIWKPLRNVGDNYNKEEARRDFHRKTVKDWIEKMEGMKPPTRISWGKVSACYRITPNIVKKVFLLPKFRLRWEIAALDNLKKYPFFPKVLYIDEGKKCFYMTDIGESFRNIKPKKIPNDLHSQATALISALKTTGVFHRDLAPSHLRIKNGQLGLLDFEKCWYTEEQFIENRSENSAMWQKLRYSDMNTIHKIISKELKRREISIKHYTK